MRQRCHCGKFFDNIGHHWEHRCDYPEIFDWQKDILVGLLMGDGCVNKRKGSNNSSFKVSMIVEEYIEWISSQFPEICSGVYKRSGENRSNTLSRFTGKDHDCKDIFEACFKSHPYFSYLRDTWYDGCKKFPDDLTLNPRIVKHWYVSDGNVGWNDFSTSQVSISCHNENHRQDYIESLFDDIGFNVSFSSNSIRIPSDQKHEFIGWLGEVPPGFEYKFEIDDRRRYEKLRPFKGATITIS